MKVVNKWGNKIIKENEEHSLETIKLFCISLRADLLSPQKPVCVLKYVCDLFMVQLFQTCLNPGNRNQFLF